MIVLFVSGDDKKMFSLQLAAYFHSLYRNHNYDYARVDKNYDPSIIPKDSKNYTVEKQRYYLYHSTAFMADIIVYAESADQAIACRDFRSCREFVGRQLVLDVKGYEGAYDDENTEESYIVKCAKKVLKAFPELKHPQQAITPERLEVIVTEAERRTNEWLKHSTFDEMSFYGSFMRFDASLGLLGGYPFKPKPEWMKDKGFGPFIVYSEFNSPECDKALRVLFEKYYPVQEVKS